MKVRIKKTGLAGELIDELVVRTLIRTNKHKELPVLQRVRYKLAITRTGKPIGQAASHGEVANKFFGCKYPQGEETVINAVGVFWPWEIEVIDEQRVRTPSEQPGNVSG